METIPRITGTVTVSGSNNRLGTTNSGSVYGQMVVNGGLAGQLVGGANLPLGELSGSTGGGLCGHAVNTDTVNPGIRGWILNTSSFTSGILLTTRRAMLKPAIRMAPQTIWWP